MNTESGIFGSIFSKDFVKSIVEAIEKPIIKANIKLPTSAGGVCVAEVGVAFCVPSNCSCNCKSLS